MSLKATPEFMLKVRQIIVGSSWKIVTRRLTIRSSGPICPSLLLPTQKNRRPRQATELWTLGVVANFSRTTTVTIIVLGLAACDTMYGVVRRAPVGETVLPIQCIEDATKGVVGVENVEYRLEDGGRQLTWSGVQDPERIHRISYDFDGLFGNFYFRTSYRGISEFSHAYIRINARPPQREIDKIRPVMLAIEQAIGIECALDLAPPAIHEECLGVQCS